MRSTRLIGIAASAVVAIGMSSGAQAEGSLPGRDRDASAREHHILPIRLTHTSATCWVLPVAGIKLGIGRRLYITGDAEQRAESVERVEAPVEAKREFVEVGL